MNYMANRKKNYWWDFGNELRVLARKGNVSGFIELYIFSKIIMLIFVMYMGLMKWTSRSEFCLGRNTFDYWMSYYCWILKQGITRPQIYRRRLLIVIVCLIVKCRAFYGDFACLQKDCFHLGPFKVINTFAVTCNIHLVY